MRMKYGFGVVTFTLTVAAIHSANPAFACTCWRESAEFTSGEAESYSLIVEAKVIGLELIDRRTNENPTDGHREADLRVKLEVIRSWTGDAPNHLELWTHSSEASCGYPFRIARQYLVFVSKGSRFVDLCSRTTESAPVMPIKRELGKWFGQPLTIQPQESKTRPSVRRSVPSTLKHPNIGAWHF